MKNHSHTYRPSKPSHIEACECGAMRVVVDAETQARREAATIAFKQRYNSVSKSR